MSDHAASRVYLFKEGQFRQRLITRASGSFAQLGVAGLKQKESEMVEEQVKEALELAWNGQGLAVKRWSKGQLIDYLENLFAGVLENLSIADLPEQTRRKIFDVVKGFYDLICKTTDIPVLPDAPIEFAIWNAISPLLSKLLKLED